MLISVICAYNNESLLNEMLVESIKKQTYKDYEIIAVDTIKMGFNSAAEALNYGSSISNGEILVFTHQDIELLDENIFYKINGYCNNNDFGLAGIAGVSLSNRKVYSNVLQGEEKTNGGDTIDEIVAVDSCDECFFFVKKNLFHGFEDLGLTWHLYAVEYSLRCINMNESVVVMPFSVFHKSEGELDSSYWKTLTRLGKKYENKAKYLPTVFGVFINNRFLFLQIIAKRAIILIRKWAKK